MADVRKTEFLGRIMAVGRLPSSYYEVMHHLHYMDALNIHAPKKKRELHSRLKEMFSANTAENRGHVRRLQKMTAPSKLRAASNVEMEKARRILRARRLRQT